MRLREVWITRLKCGFVGGMIILTAGCSKAHAGPAAAASPSPASTWPSYPASEYERSDHPGLTSTQVALIRKTLSLLKACQAVQLRYAFPSNDQKSMVLFFDSPQAGFVPHVLWTYNIYYNRASGLAQPASYDANPAPKWLGTASEVKAQSCATPLP